VKKDIQPDDDSSPGAKSKSQVKRELDELKAIGTRLVELPAHYLSEMPDEVAEAVRQAGRIHRGSARKRQIQYIGKLLREDEGTRARQLLDRYDSASTSHQQQFHRLERWRDQLLIDESAIIDEIRREIPDLDVQQLRTMVRQARREEEDRSAFRRIFQFLKESSEA
jgi:ribosome-associated protein